jgi:uncharacterized protein
MSFVVDVNVLLYASDASSDKHSAAREFLRRCAAGPELMCLGWVTLMSYLRMATHPKIFSQPLSHDEAAGNVDTLLQLPHVRALAEGESFWSHYRSLSKDVPTRANLVPDVHLAALMREHGVTVIYTNDRDFRKFDFLDVRDPLA